MPSAPRKSSWPVVAAGGFVVVVVAVALLWGGGGAPVHRRTTKLPDFDNAGPCPVVTVAGVPAGSGCISEGTGDLDGDGKPDHVYVYARLGPGRTPVAWVARAVMGAGWDTFETPIPVGAAVGGVTSIYPRVIATFDANADGRAEILVKLGAILYHVAGQHIMGLYGFFGAALQPVEIRGQGPLVFDSGGTSRLGQGAACTTRGGHPVFVIRRIQQVPPPHWERTERFYRWVGESLVPDGEHSDRLPLSVELPDPRVLDFYEIRCGSLVTD